MDSFRPAANMANPRSSSRLLSIGHKAMLRILTDQPRWRICFFY
jgi:hypothetical protein